MEGSMSDGLSIGTQIASILAALFAGGALLFTWLQWKAAKGIKKQRIEDLTDEIMFFAEYYDNKLNAKGFVPKKKLVPVELNDVPNIRKAIRDRLMQEVSP
jgi:predicted tellurium resistance membrane protein TerC